MDMNSWDFRLFSLLLIHHTLLFKSEVIQIYFSLFEDEPP